MMECDECEQEASWALCEFHEQRHEKSTGVILKRLRQVRVEKENLEQQIQVATAALGKIYGPVARQALEDIQELNEQTP